MSDNSTLEESLSHHEVHEDQRSQTSLATHGKESVNMLPVQFNSSTVHPTTKAPEALSVESDSESDDSKGNSKKTKESRKTKEDKGIQYYSNCY